jgi:predicted nucleotidyltransferase/DNA-binding XRE family transcriptional regulator
MNVHATAGELLRDARERAGLTQRELADRAGVAQSVISMYESGRRQPSLPTLMALLRGAGFELDLRLNARPAAGGSVKQRLHERRADVRAAAKRHHVKVLGVFGSVARGDERSDSDVDLLLDVPDDVGLLTLGRLERELRQILDADIDLVPEAGLKPAVRKRVMKDLVPL